MSYQANIRTVSKIKYHPNKYFNYNWDAIGDLLTENCENSIICDDTGLSMRWEIYKEDLSNLIQQLEKRNQEEAIGDRSVSYVIKIFKRWLEIQEENKANLDNPDYIIIDWF